MLLFDLLALADPEVTAKEAKLHLASRGGDGRHTLDIYLAGKFDAWQRWQANANFRLPLVVALIELPQPRRWLFVGTYDSHGFERRPRDDGGTYCDYRLERRGSTAELEGRLVVSFRRPGRNAYLLAENHQDQLRVEELRPEKMRIEDFPGYLSVCLTKAHLDIVVRQNVESWRGALSSVSGVYVITDTRTGKQYVGSATGAGGIWGRWVAYSDNGHGGNKELKRLLKEKGADYAANFQYGVLEIADTHTGPDQVMARESHWKDLLQTRVHGLNEN